MENVNIKHEFLIRNLLVFLYITGISSTDMYLPSLPSITEEFNTTVQMGQLTITIFLVGLFFFRLFFGPLSDFYGRRKILLTGLVIFTIATVFCMYSTNIYMLIIGRGFQAMGICSAGTISPAIVKDIYGEKSGKILGYMASIFLLAPVVAPFIGAFIETYYGWRMIFKILAVLSCILLVLTFIFLKETHPDLENEKKFNFKNFFNNYLEVIKNKEFLQYSLIVGATFAGLLAFITGSSNYFLRINNLSPLYFGVYYSFILLGQIIGNLITWLLPTEKIQKQLVFLGITISFIASTLILLLGIAGAQAIIVFVIPMFTFLLGVGVIVPNSISLALNSVSESTGSASGVLGFIQMALGSLGSFFISMSTKATIMPMRICIFTATLLSIIILFSFSQKFIAYLHPNGRSRKT